MTALLRLASGLLVLLMAAAADAAPITALAFSPDSKILVSNGTRAIELRSPLDASVQDRIPCALAKITSLAFDPDGRWLAVAGGTPGVVGEILLIDWRAKKIRYRLTNHTDLAMSVAFDPRGTSLAVAAADHTGRVWRIPEDGSPPRRAFDLTGHAAPVLALAFSPSGQNIVTASADRSIKVWSAEDGKIVRTFSQHTEAAHALVFRPSMNAATAPSTCATGADDRTVRIWQPEIGRMVRIIRQHQGPIFALAYTADGTALFSAGREGIIRRLDAESDLVLSHWQAHDDWIYALAVSSDGAHLASADWSGTVRTWDLRAPIAQENRDRKPTP